MSLCEFFVRMVSWVKTAVRRVTATSHRLFVGGGQFCRQSLGFARSRKNSSQWKPKIL